MIIDTSKIPETWDIRMVKVSIYQSFLRGGRKNSIYQDAKGFITQNGKLKKFTFTLDTDKFFERVKGQEGKYAEAIRRMKRIMEYASQFN